MKCNHPVPVLMGTAEGIKCTVCGRVFLTLDDVANDNPIKPEKEKKSDE